MKTCPYCAFVNREGVMYCEECGHPFIGSPAFVTSRIVEDNQNGARGRVTWGTARFDDESSIVIHVRDHPDALTVIPKEELIVGRMDMQSQASPDIDMEPFDAAKQGVSRRHAMIKRGEDTLTLIDLDSTNGTYLNGQRLIPKQPRVLRDGDEVRLGKLVFHIFFK